jgi:hypothetical protein
MNEQKIKKVLAYANIGNLIAVPVLAGVLAITSDPVLFGFGVMFMALNLGSFLNGLPNIKEQLFKKVENGK